jgi:type IV secretion system protein TrbL
MLGVWKNLASGSVTSIGSDILLGMGLVVAAICALAGFAIIALQLLLTQVELAIIAPIGVVMLGFFAAPATKAIAEKFPSYLISVGVKLMFIFAMASLGPKIGEVAITNIQTLSAAGDQRLAGVLGLSFSVLIYGILCLQIPAMASGMLSGSVSTSLGGIAGGAMAAGGAVAGAAMAAGGAAAGAAKAGLGISGSTRGAMDAMSVLMGGGGDVSAWSGNPLDASPSGSSASSSSPFGEDPFKNYVPPASGAPDSIGGTPSTPSQPKGQSTFSSGMDKLNQGIGGLAASEGQTGSGVDINSGNHGS